MLQDRPFGDRAFHGDEYLLRLVDCLISGCNLFVETGTHRGDTLAYVVHNYPHCYSIGCEPNREYTKEAIARDGKKIVDFANAENLSAHANAVKIRMEDLDYGIFK